MSAKDKKSEVFSYLKNVKCEFIAMSHIFYSNKTANRQDCNRQSMQRVQMLAHKCNFPKSHFLDSGRKK